jgi:hypothetical protein
MFKLSIDLELLENEIIDWPLEFDLQRRMALEECSELLLLEAAEHQVDVF